MPIRPSMKRLLQQILQNTTGTVGGATGGTGETTNTLTPEQQAAVQQEINSTFPNKTDLQRLEVSEDNTLVVNPPPDRDGDGIPDSSDTYPDDPTNTPPDTTAPVITASLPSGDYGEVKQLTLTSNETSTIYYTTDGTTPTTSSSVYSSPITIDHSMSVKFFGKDSKGNSSTVQSISYIIDLDYDDDGIPNNEDLYPNDPTNTPPVPATQDGTNTYPYVLQTVQDLLDIKVKGLNKSYLLWNDIDLSSVNEWSSLGIFTGTFNGQNYTISNMKTVAPTVGTGLFTDLQTGTIKNLTISNATITTNKVNSGVIVGKKTSGVIENCRVVNSTITATNYNIGFICGNNLAGSILKTSVKDCNLTINAGSYNASLFTGDNRAIIKECYATGSIAVNNNAAYTGAFAGTLGSGSDIDDVYVVNTFSGTHQSLTTGFTSATAGTINNVYTKVNTAKMTFSSSGTLTLTNGYYKVDTFQATPTRQGTEVLDLSVQSAFVGFDFTTPLWKMSSTKNRPVLVNNEEL